MTTLDVQFLSPESTREELETALALVNLEAQAERRRGYAGVNGQRYADLHDFLNALLDLLEG